MLVGLRPERQSLVDGDVADAELARLLDQLESRFVVDEVALGVGRGIAGLVVGLEVEECLEQH